MPKGDNGKSISFKFRPYKFDVKKHAYERVEKADSGEDIKRRYVAGITSGLKLDAHGERMTAKCIKSFMDQAGNGDILLYLDLHGVRSTDDIGILSKAEILPNGDWFTEYRLYDEHDNIGPVKLEKADDTWKQINGIAPYKKPRQKGFSIEGLIPEDGIVTATKDEEGNIGQRVIDDIDLDGVVLVPKPAYHDGMATAIYKAFGENHPEHMNKLQKSIKGEMRRRVNEEEIRDKYYSKKWDIQDALDSTIDKIMRDKSIADKEEALEIAFSEYQSLMIEILLASQDLFLDEDDLEVESNDNIVGMGIGKSSKLDVYRRLYKSLSKLIKIQKSNLEVSKKWKNQKQLKK